MSAVAASTERMADLSEVEARAVEAAVAAARRYLWLLPADDQRQIARQRVLELRLRGYEVLAPEQQHNYLAWSAQGAIRDECRRLAVQSGGSRAQPASRVVSLDAIGADHEDGLSPVLDRLQHLDTPDSELAVAQALHAVAAMPEPLPRVMRLCLTGSSVSHIAQQLGVSSVRVTQLRHQLARLLDRYLVERATPSMPRL